MKCMTNSFCSMKSVYFIFHKPASSKVETTSINAFVPFANASNSDRTRETTMLRFVTSNPRIHIAQLQVRSIVPIIPFVLRKRTILTRWSVNTLMHTFQQVQSKCWCSSEWYEYDQIISNMYKSRSSDALVLQNCCCYKFHQVSY